MVLFSLLLHDSVPFGTVYFHNLVRDSNGEKMSKSKGNVIDPLEVIDGIELKEMVAKIQNGLIRKEDQKKWIKQKRQNYPHGIPACGADALRVGLLSQVKTNRDINMNMNIVVNFRKFNNKIW